MREPLAYRIPISRPLQPVGTTGEFVAFVYEFLFDTPERIDSLLFTPAPPVPSNFRRFTTKLRSADVFATRATW
jgi:hypothetical protein